MRNLLYGRSGLSLIGGLILMLLFSSALFLPAIGEAQAQHAGNWKSFVNSDYVNDVAVHEGTVWQGVNGGLVVRSLFGPDVSRYYHKLNSGLQASQVLSVAVDGGGNVWVGTDRGAFRRNIYGGWSNINRDNSPLTVNTVRVVVPDDEGGVWFGTWLGGAYYRDGQNEWTAYNTQNSGIGGNRIYAIVPDGNGGVWFGTDSRGVAYIDAGGEWTVYNAANSLLPTNDVQDILIDYEDRVWFATMSGLAYLDRGNEEGEAENGDVQWEIFNLQNSQIPSEIVNSLALDEEGILWMGTNGGIASLQDVAEGGTWEVYTPANSNLPAPVIRGIGIDVGGTVWAGTWGGGMAGLNPQSSTFRVYRHDTVNLTGRSYLPSNTVNKILPFPEGNDRGKVWFATDTGVASYDGTAEKWETLDANNNLPVSQVVSMARDDDGNIAFATGGGGLAVRSEAGDEWQYYSEENSDIPSDNLVDVTYDGSGGTWVVTLGGRAAYRGAGGAWTVYDPAGDVLPDGNYRLNSVYCDGAGNTWFGTWGGGALRLDEAGNWTAYKAGEETGMPANDVSRVAIDGADNTWFGTWGGGMVRLNSEGNWAVFNSDNSALPSDIIRDLVVDSRDWVWAATPLGVAYYDGESWNIMRSRDSGLPVNSIWNMAADATGNVWFTTNENGVAVYNPAGVVAALTGLTDITERETESIIYFEDNYLEADVAPIMQDYRLLLPLRALGEALGATFEWNGETGKVEMILDDKKVELHINDTEAFINGEAYTLDVPAQLRGGRTMIPVRFVSESLGLTVTWDSVVRAAFLR